MRLVNFFADFLMLSFALFFLWCTNMKRQVRRILHYIIVIFSVM
jgi:hypothetical protein